MLELAGVRKRFGGKTVLRDISFAVAPGTITLVAGANGSGKSTLLRLMAGLLRPDEGTISSRVPEGKTALLAHQTMLYPELTALENLDFWCRLAGPALPEAALKTALDRVRLAAHAHEKAGAFSRGMAQRLALARVLLAEPELMLLDEPATGLDAESAAQLRQEALAARSRGAALVWVSHSPESDLALADTALLLEKKRLAYHGPAAGFPLPASGAVSASTPPEAS
jgi:heme exporter protein A